MIVLFCVYVLIWCFVNHLVVFCPFYDDHYFICVYSPPVYRGVRVTRSVVLYLCIVDSRLTFCSLSFWPLCCLFVFDIRLLITPLVSSNSSQIF